MPQHSGNQLERSTLEHFLSEWLESLVLSLPFLAAPFSTWLNNKLGTRSVVLSGVVIASGGLFLTSMASDSVMLFLVYGIIVSSGITLIICPPFLSLDDYFPDDYEHGALVTSISNCAIPLSKLPFI